MDSMMQSENRNVSTLARMRPAWLAAKVTTWPIRCERSEMTVCSSGRNEARACTHSQSRWKRPPGPPSSASFLWT